MSSQNNPPPPPQYPNYSSSDNPDTILSKENSVMENSVIYISDSGSPNYKNNRTNSYPHSTNQILPNLVNSINCTYQNLPPKSPKSNYRNILTNNEWITKNNQWRQVDQQNEQVIQTYRPCQNTSVNKQNQQYWMVRSREDAENDNGFRERPENLNSAATKTRSHPNLMNDYVNLAGTETLLNDILQNRNNRPYIPVTNDSNKNCMFKPHPMLHEQYNTVMGPVPSSPEMVNNGIHMYPSQGITEYASNPDNFSTESSRLVNILLEENKRLRSKLRQSDSRLEYVDQLERKIHNLEILFEELLTSQRRQRLLDLQLQQASLTNYIVKNVSQSDVAATTNITTTSNNTASTQGVTSSSSLADNNRPIDLRKTTISNSQSIIPSSPIITQKLNEESPGERSVAMSSRSQKNEVTKVYFDQKNANEPERYLMESECPENWIEQSHISPVHEIELNMNTAHYQKSSDDDLCSKLKQTIKSVNIATSPYFNRASDNSQPSLIGSPSELLGRKVLMSPIIGPARNWLVHQSSTPPAYRLRLCQQQQQQLQQQQLQHQQLSSQNVVNNHRVITSNKATSAMNLTSS